MARLIRMLHVAHGAQCPSPLPVVIRSPTATVEEVNDVVMRVALSYTSAGSSEVQA